jgi:hypothetical protein
MKVKVIREGAKLDPKKHDSNLLCVSDTTWARPDALYSTKTGTPMNTHIKRPNF